MISKAGLLFTVKAIVVLVVFMLVLPSGKLVKSVPIQRTNIRFVKASIVLLASGSLLMGLAWGYWIIIPGVIVYAAGFGFSTLVRTLVTSTVPEEYIARLYSGLALAETVGSLTGSVALTASFTTSMKLGAVGMGLPYYICSVSSRFKSCHSILNFIAH